MKKLIKYFMTLITCLSIFIFLFVLSSSISKDSIKKNLNESSKYIKNKVDHKNAIKKIDATKNDLPADIIILNIAASQNNKEPFKSILKSKYYEDYLLSNRKNLEKITNKNVKPNEQYLRYWHGSITIIKPLLVFFNLKQIMIINYILLSILLIKLLSILYKENKRLSIITLIAFICCYSFIVPMTLEYTWNYYIMMIISIIAIKLDKRNKPLDSLFIISGISTSFFDFLTTDTITLTLPLILITILRINRNKKIEIKGMFKEIIKYCILWLAGYGLTWLTKWILASIVLKINAFNYVVDPLMTRVNGKVDSSFFYQVLNAVLKNCSNIMIFSIFNKYKIFILSVFSIIIFSFFYLFRKEKKELHISRLIFLIGLIPIIRFIFLSNHSYIHSHFTYRSLLSSIICLYYALYYGLDTKLIKRLKMQK